MKIFRSQNVYQLKKTHLISGTFKYIVFKEFLNYDTNIF